MVSVNDFKKNGVVKGTTGIFKGVVLKENKEQKVEIWNGYKVYTVEACDVDQIVCEHLKKNEKEETRTFVLPTKFVNVTVKLPIGHGRWFLKLARSKIMQFLISNDLATTDHKLHGMTKKYLIVSQLNYSTPYWIYVVLSRVTSLDGLFLLQPIKEDYNPQPSKLLKKEWKNQWDKEIELILFLHKSGKFLEEVDVHDLALKLNHGNVQSDKCNTSSIYSNTSRTKISRKYTSFSPSGLNQLLGLRNKFHRVHLEECQCGGDLMKLKQT
jgi:hypothetical protein